MEAVLQVDQKTRPTSKQIFDFEWIDKELLIACKQGKPLVKQQNVYLHEVADLTSLKQEEHDDELGLTQQEQDLFNDF